MSTTVCGQTHSWQRHTTPCSILLQSCDPVGTVPTLTATTPLQSKQLGSATNTLQRDISIICGQLALRKKLFKCYNLIEVGGGEDAEHSDIKKQNFELRLFLERGASRSPTRNLCCSISRGVGRKEQQTAKQPHSGDSSAL